MKLRLSDHSLERLMQRAEPYIQYGWKVERPIYVDWWWRGYSIRLYFPPLRCV